MGESDRKVLYKLLLTRAKNKFMNRYPVSLNSLDDDEGKKNSSKAAPGAEIHEIATCSAV